MPKVAHDATRLKRGVAPLSRDAVLEVGDRALALAKELYPICRSITGPGTRASLKILQRELPGLTLHAVPSGTACFDWIVPDEWEIREAFIEDAAGRRIVDFADHNLHEVNYSTPIDAVLTLEELRPHLYSLPDLPKAIPYVTSYYKQRWGFCLSHEQLLALTPGSYRVRIDSRIAPGQLSYGEILIPGNSAQEIFLSTYVCHPSMANNELSGPVVTTEILRWIASCTDRKYSYRAVFIPETIGSIVYLSRNLAVLKERVIAGFNVTCIGDERAYSHLPSRQTGTMADRAALHALAHHAGAQAFKRYSFLDRGSDERQYCSPGIDLPVTTIMRSKYGEYPEYHTSLDNFDLVTSAGLAGGFQALALAIATIESNGTYRTTVLGEPQLGRRGLYPSVGTRRGSDGVRDMMAVLAYGDGAHDLLAIADLLQVPIWELVPIVDQLLAHGLLEQCDEPKGSADHGG